MNTIRPGGLSQSSRLRLVLLINVVMIFGLVVVGLTSHSLGVLAAGGDYIADSVAIGLGLVAIRISKHPHGHPKATSVVALINASFLLVASLVVIVEALRRLLHHTPHVGGRSAMIVALVATLAMIGGALILNGDDSDDDLHMRSVILDTVADAAAAAAVGVAGGIIFFTDRFYWLDSALAGLIAVVVAFHAAKLARDVNNALRKQGPLRAAQP